MHCSIPRLITAGAMDGNQSRPRATRGRRRAVRTWMTSVAMTVYCIRPPLPSHGARPARRSPMRNNRNPTAVPKLRVHGFALSIDGYGVGPDQDLENPLG